MEKTEMKKIFWLVNKADGRVVSFFNVDTECRSFEWELIAEVGFRFDGCTHWWFRGEDWEGTKETEDAYYHICGAGCMLDMMRNMAFVWTVCGKLQEEWHEKEFYREDEGLNRLIESALEGYEIQEHLGKSGKKDNEL